VAMASATAVRKPTAAPKQPTRGRLASGLGKVFELNPAGLNWARGVMFLDVALVPLVVFWAIGHEQYLVSAIFGALFAILADPGGTFGQRTLKSAIFGLAGAGVTALAFAIAGSSWGWLVLATFAVTLVASLADKYGLHRFVAALLLTIWFVIALALGVALHKHTEITNLVWAQVAAWAGGTALWIAVTFVAWLIRGRTEVAQPVAELPGDTSARKLTAPLIMFAVVRALAMAGATAIAYGLDISHADWLPIATIIAMKPSLAQSTLTAVKRVVGALIGALAAGLILLIPAHAHGLRAFEITRALEVVAIVLLMHGAAIRFWTYTLYTAAIAAGVLVVENLTQPSDYSAEGDRVLWTLAGTGIGVLVMLLAGLLGKRRAKASQPA
jgi:uncharacterized membrane protein YccC